MAEKRLEEPGFERWVSRVRTLSVLTTAPLSRYLGASERLYELALLGYQPLRLSLHQVSVSFPSRDHVHYRTTPVGG